MKKPNLTKIHMNKNMISLTSLRWVLQQLASETGEPVFKKMVHGTDRLIANYGSDKKVPVKLAEDIITNGLEKAFKEGIVDEKA